MGKNELPINSIIPEQIQEQVLKIQFAQPLRRTHQLLAKKNDYVFRANVSFKVNQAASGLSTQPRSQQGKATYPDFMKTDSTLHDSIFNIGKGDLREIYRQLSCTCVNH